MVSFYLVALVVVLIFPFDFYFSFFRSPIKRHIQTNGVQILSTAGIKTTSGAEKIYEKMISGYGITIEVWAAIKDFSQKGPARIVSYSFDKNLRNFTLAQDNSNLIFRLRTTNNNLNGTNPEIRFDGLLTGNNFQQIVLTYDYSEVKVFINGLPKKEVPGPGGNFSNWDSSYPLVIANEATGNRPWLGRLFLVAIYNRSLSEMEVIQNYNQGGVFDLQMENGTDRVKDGLVVLYFFNEKNGAVVYDRSEIDPLINLKIFNGPMITNQPFLLGPYKDFKFTKLQVLEVIGNIILFIPFGYLFYSMMRCHFESFFKLFAIILLSSSFFILCLESLQYYSLARFSSMTDVVNNLIGVLFGILINKVSLNRPGLKNFNKELFC